MSGVAIFAMSWLTLTPALIAGPWWVPKAWASLSGIWQRRSYQAGLFRVVLGLLDQGGWTLTKHTATHPSGVLISGSEWSYLSLSISGKDVPLALYWKRRLGKRVAEVRADLEAADLERRTTEFASNVIDFAKAKARS